MTISPEEIEHKQFMPAVRGYDREEVDAFLRVLSSEVRALAERARAATDRADAAERDGYDRLGSEIANVLRSARDAAAATREEARGVGEQLVREALEDAARIRREAQAEAELALGDAQAELRRAISRRRRVETASRELSGRLEMAEELMSQLRVELAQDAASVVQSAEAVERETPAPESAGPPSSAPAGVGTGELAVS